MRNVNNAKSNLVINWQDDKLDILRKKEGECILGKRFSANIFCMDFLILFGTGCVCY